jgi:hypothetical protein
MGSGLELQIQLGCILFVLASFWADKHCEHLSKGLSTTSNFSCLQESGTSRSSLMLAPSTTLKHH